MNSRSVAIFAVVVAVIVGAAYWFINGENAPHYTAPPPDVKKAPSQENTASSEPSNPPSRFTPEPAFVPDKVPVAPGNPTVVMTEDDRKIDDALNLYKGNTDQDHLNTAQALNRLLDDNREIFIHETQSAVRAHPEFMLFATQNPSGAYGGRKALSRAFRNRFIELHFEDIPEEELTTILEKRGQLPSKLAVKLVAVMKDLQKQRQVCASFIVWRL